LNISRYQKSGEEEYPRDAVTDLHRGKGFRKNHISPPLERGAYGGRCRAKETNGVPGPKQREKKVNSYRVRAQSKKGKDRKR